MTNFIGVERLLIGSATPEVRGTAEPHAEACPPTGPFPLVRSHDTHHYPTADTRTETDGLTLTGADPSCAPFSRRFRPGECSMLRAQTSKLLASHVNYLRLSWQ